MRRPAERLAAVAAVVLAGAGVDAGQSSTAGIMSGTAVIRYRLPAGDAEFPSYVNTGYRQQRDGDSLRVEVDITSADWTRAPFRLREIPPLDEPVARFARQAVAGATIRAEAVARVLHAVAARTTYRIDGDVPSDPVEVLERGEAHCVGRSNLAIAALATLGIRARSARGLLIDDDGRGIPHRWIEVFYPDAGWVFSDPTETVNYVSPRHVILTPPEAPDPAYRPGRHSPPHIVEQDDRIVPIDLHPARRSTLAERRRGRAQYAGAIIGQVVPATAGRLTLIGRGTRRSVTVDAGRPFAFPGLEAGAYTLESEFGGARRSQTVRVTTAELIHLEIAAP